MLSSGWVLLRSYGFALPVFPLLGGGFCPQTVEMSAERRAKPPVPQGQRDELLTWCSSADEEDKEGVYGSFCQRSSECSPEDERDYASVDDVFLPSLGGSFLRRTWEHRPRFISLPEDHAGSRGDATSKKKFFSSGEALPFDELSQTKHRHVLEHEETHPVWLPELLWADLERDHDILDWEEDEDNTFSLPPGEMKMWPSRLVSVSVFRAYS
ncbi:uncharacterized protein LJ206_015389 [Theristicus caerulescens]